MPEPKEIAIAALKRMLEKVGPDAEFPGDAIWEHASENVDPLRKPPVFKALSAEGYLEDTGEKTNAVTAERRAAPTTKYRFGRLLKPQSPNGALSLEVASTIVKEFQKACDGNLQIDPSISARLIASLLSKRFLILTGLAGSGKTKLAQAFARWITPNRLASDVFSPGSKIPSDRTAYLVNRSDSLAVEFWNDEKEDRAIKVTLPREIIMEWVNYIEEHSIPEGTPPRDIREAVKPASKYSDQLHSFESNLKAAAFAYIKNKSQTRPAYCYALVPVGADWTGNENVLGYPNALDPKNYVSKPTLDLILRASENPDLPHFLILDEMNLSHVERYFADLLSAMESSEELPLYQGDLRTSNGKTIPRNLRLPENLFIIGTVNVDETTYMFSPKVLDRANVIEFRVTDIEMAGFLAAPKKPDLEKLAAKGITFGRGLVAAARNSGILVPAEVKTRFEAEMGLFFSLQREHGAEYGFRVAHEASRLLHFCKALSQAKVWDAAADNGNGDWLAEDTAKRDWFDVAFDALLIQKFLPKLHGSKAKLGPLLKKVYTASVQPHDPAARDAKGLLAKLLEPARDIPRDARYPITAEKVFRMWRQLNENGFTSFPEN